MFFGPIPPPPPGPINTERVIYDIIDKTNLIYCSLLYSHKVDVFSILPEQFDTNIQISNAHYDAFWFFWNIDAPKGQ